jgi:hypothetical protein
MRHVKLDNETAVQITCGKITGPQTKKVGVNDEASLSSAARYYIGGLQQQRANKKLTNRLANMYKHCTAASCRHDLWITYRHDSPFDK